MAAGQVRAGCGPGSGRGGGDPRALVAGVVADDLTGAAATASLLAGVGLRAEVALAPWPPARAVGTRARVRIVSIGSRHLPAALAAAAAGEATRALASAGARLIGKRVDSTLRGNIGAELDAVLTAWQARVGKTAVRALLSAAYPAAGRAVRNGGLYLGGEAMGLSIAGAVRAQSARSVAHVELERIRGLDVDALAAHLDALAARADVLIPDAEAGADLERLAAAVHRLEAAAGSVGRFVLADPGPTFAARLRLALGAAPQPAALVVGGSATALAARQCDEAGRIPGATTLVLDAARLAAADAGYAQRQAGEAASALARGAGPVLLRSRRTSDQVLVLDAGPAAALARAMGRVAAAAVAAAAPQAVVAVGGETAAALCEALGVRRLAPLCAPEPLVAHLRCVGGLRAGLDLVTKGGLVGDARTLVRLVDHVAACRPGRRARSRPSPAEFSESEEEAR